MERRTLTFVLIALTVVGLGFAAWPFVTSLRPTARAGDFMRRVDVSSLANGHFIAVDGGAVRFFVVKLESGQLSVLYVPYAKGRGTMMPDISWWRYGTRCQDFGPDNVDGRLLPGAQFKCRDGELDEWWGPHWRWDMRGRYIGPSDATFDDMPSLTPRLEGGELFLPSNL